MESICADLKPRDNEGKTGGKAAGELGSLHLKVATGYLSELTDPSQMAAMHSGMTGYACVRETG